MIWKNENQFDALVAQASAKTGVPAHIIKGTIAKESSFKPTAYRGEPQLNDASRGLMQVLWSTAQWIGYKGEPSDLYRPDVAIPVGSAVLRRYYDWATRYGGGWEDALSIYNGGSTKGKPGLPRKTPDGKYKNQQYVDDVKVYAAYFAGQVPEPAVKQYQRTKVLTVAVPLLGAALALGLLVLVWYQSRALAL